MENEYYEEKEQGQDEHVEIYSKWAIRGFSIFFSTIFGGVLLYQNLKDVGYKKAAAQVIWFSVIFTVIPIFIIGFSGMDFNKARPIGFIFNIVGGFILSDYFFPKYFPDDDYYSKPIWKALGVSVGIILIYVLLVLAVGGVPLK